MTLDQSLPAAGHLTFPLRIEADGPRLSSRLPHLRELIEQVLLTAPGERVFRPDWGAGARALVFEPATSAVGDVVEKRLRAALTDVLAGEVDPRSLDVEVRVFADDRLEVLVAYTLATIGRREAHRFQLDGSHG